MAMEITPVDIDSSGTEDQMFSNADYSNGAPFKRRREDLPYSSGAEIVHRHISPPQTVSKMFLVLRPDRGVFHSEDFRDEQTLFLPLSEHGESSEFLVNVRTVEQISFCNGTYSIGNTHMRFCRKAEGELQFAVL